MRLYAFIAGFLLSATIIIFGNNIAVAQEETDQQNTNIITVASGDTLEKIAITHNTTYPRVFDANEKIKDPDLIYAGDQLRIPAPDEVLPKRQIEQPVQAVKSAPKNTSSNKSAAVSTTTHDGGVWDRLAACESGGNWSTNTGNGYYGGLQFSQTTWRAVGGSGSPHQASKAEQINRGKILQQRSGWGQWPACSVKLGLR